MPLQKLWKRPRYNQQKAKKNSNKKQIFGDNYKMKDKYIADLLVVARLARVSSKKADTIYEETKQKYIFEIILENNEIKYREVSTGFIAEDKESYPKLPYITGNIEPYTKYFPEMEGKEVSRLCLLWNINDINYPKKKEKTKEKVL